MRYGKLMKWLIPGAVAFAFVLSVGSQKALADTCSTASTTGSCTIDLTVNNGFAPAGTDFGTITLTLVAGTGTGTGKNGIAVGDNGIQVSISMNTNYGIHNNGFGFNYDGNEGDLTLVNGSCSLTSPGTPTCNPVSGALSTQNLDGFGSFMENIGISGTNGQANDPTSMSFLLSASNQGGFTDLSNIILGNNTGSNNFFAAQVAYIPVSGCTGFAGNAGSTNNSNSGGGQCGGEPVPEPGSLMLLGTGLLGLGGLVRRKFGI